jgi:hypothetical protein
MFRPSFNLSMSSKALLSVIPQAMSSKFSVVLHMDCTFQCNNNELHPAVTQTRICEDIY